MYVGWQFCFCEVLIQRIVGCLGVGMGWVWIRCILGSIHWVTEGRRKISCKGMGSLVALRCRFDQWHQSNGGAILVVGGINKGGREGVFEHIGCTLSSEPKVEASHGVESGVGGPHCLKDLPHG